MLLKLALSTCTKVQSLSIKNIMAQLPNVVFVLGGPGAGKGTQCLNIVRVNFFKIIIKQKNDTNCNA